MLQASFPPDLAAWGPPCIHSSRRSLEVSKSSAPRKALNLDNLMLPGLSWIDARDALADVASIWGEDLS